MITFCLYQKEYYQTVCDFLIEINKENSHHLNWNWARFEWMHEHPMTNKEQLGSMGLWFDDGHLAGAALFDMYFGEAFVGVLERYESLYPEALHYAFEHLKDDQGLGISFLDENKGEIEEALKQGFFKAEAEEVVREIALSEDLPVEVPDGFTVEEFDAQEHAKEMSWLMYQGFDHGEDFEAFEEEFEKPTAKRPHFNPYLCIVIRDKEGALAASASTWYDIKTDYAYLEPVCVIPKYRKMGLGKAAVYQALNNARMLGAKRAIVTSDQPFYERLGFIKKQHYSFYWKKEERVVHNMTYRLEKLLGKGKGGYSYLVKQGENEYVLKQIHHEPCDYYQFGNKIEAENNDYKRLCEAGIRIPKMLDIDMEAEIIIKEYIEGDVISDLLKEGKPVDAYIPQVQEMARLAKKAGLNIDYYPTNFVVRDGLLYYIDYECNAFMDEWSLENWGMKYWKAHEE